MINLRASLDAIGGPERDPDWMAQRRMGNEYARRRNCPRLPSPRGRLLR